MSKRSEKAYLLDIQEAIKRTLSYISGLDYSSFARDYKTQDAVIRNLEIIGEATKSLSTDTRLRYSDVPWKSMAGIRDKLIHDYFGVNIDIIWYVCVDELPKVAVSIEKILQSDQNN